MSSVRELGKYTLKFLGLVAAASMLRPSEAIPLESRYAEATSATAMMMVWERLVFIFGV